MTTTRRGFLGASVAAGFTIVSPHVLGGARHVAPSDRVNVALIGAGGQGRSNLRELFKLADVQVEGPLAIGKNESALRYQRTFLAQPQGVTIRTSLRAKEPIALKELYESLPLFLHDAPQVQDARVTVQFQVEGQWRDGATVPQANVKAIRVERFRGALLVTLDRPRTVQLASSQWKDGYQTRATCQTVLIHLLDGAGPQRMDAASIEYTLAAASRPMQKK